ncbi:hypothetical protein PHYSODRAFT_320624 [Phytophthora sojae]|uniref:Uncharacterized protein n=1 Tax=Phytophthora sojae (strain P6497) TaxID=1094619 RepID=G4YLV0_PHYSP|nr:hypothetical protein PHYSODRAFT_320624 [Phytophthora sojae]EGZ26720.1 hypothetical protein PHYSODRAFT_320624 [Phytophthora sojae]|eukprot:XP_009513995.1 hypothetical protein PHYSODRAFT_320624 [Phytophthora sojae]
MDQAADDAPRAAPPFPSASGDLVLAAASLDIPASDVALAQTVYATPATTQTELDARTSSLALPHSETPSQLFALGVVAASARNQDSHRRVGNQKKKANTGETSIATKQPSFAWTTAAADALLRARFDTAATFFSKLCCRTLAAANRTP